MVEVARERDERQERLRTAVLLETVAQEQLRQARIAMTRAGANWEVDNTAEAWQELQDTSDAWSIAMAQYRLARRRADRLRIHEGETGEEGGS